MLISTIISSFFMVLIVFIIWNNYTDKKTNIFKIKSLTLLLVTSLFSLINYFYGNKIIKIINITLFFIGIYFMLYKKQLKHCVYNALFIQSLYIIGEVIYSLFALCFVPDVEIFVKTLFGSFISNVSISIISFIISRFKFIKRIYNSINKIIYRLDDNTVAFFTIIIICIYNLLTMTAFKQIDSKYLLFQTLLISLILVGLFIYIIKIKDDNIELLLKLDENHNSIKILEDLIKENRVEEHENKNHLRCIKTMTKNRKVNEFIDSILKEPTSDNKLIRKELSKLPTNGLSGILYTKILLMKEHNIDYELDISNTFRILDFNKYNSSTSLDISNILGVFLDNAIEYVNILEERYIIIELYVEDYICISITNPIKEYINIDQIYEKGFTTKSNGHGFGLSLVKKLVDRNKLLSITTEISDGEFTQILKIKK